MNKTRITPADIAAFKREMLEKSVMVTPEAAASILAVSLRTLRRYLETGRLAYYNPHVNQPGELRRGNKIRAVDLAAFVASMRVDVAEA